MDKKILTYNDLVKIKPGENNEKIVDLQESAPDIICYYQKQDMLAYTGNIIYVRNTVAKMLIEANKKLQTKNKSYRLKVVYGYRHPEVQKLYFNNRKKQIKNKFPNLPEDEISYKTNFFVAAPDVAGHITGGAIDITISKISDDLDMGTKIADFSDENKIQTFAKNISKTQKQNRMLLHDIMMEVGFAPFYGEWWHFSYGDKEWAAFYHYSKSIYSEINFKK